MRTINNRTAAEWLNMIRCGETSTLQFKRESVDSNKLTAELVAFANSGGGTILFGIEDKTGEIIGLDYEQVQRLSREVGNVANETVRPTIYLQTEVLCVEGKNILAVYVDEGICKPYKDLGGNIWVKQGADKRRITENSEILRLFSSSRIYNPDESPIMGTTLDDLDDKKIDYYLQKVYGKGREDFDVPFTKLIANLRIADENGNLTMAGLLYFGRNPQQFKPAYCIKAVSFYGNDMGGLKYRDSKDLMGTIPELFDQAIRFLDINLHHVQAGQSFNSLGVLEVSRVALEEILQNALVHREYIKQAPIRLLIFDNRIEIISPGCLPDGLTVEEIKLGNTAQRNPLIATFCTRTMLYRGLGTGIIRAMKEEKDIRFINDEPGNQFTIIIRRKGEKDIESRSNDESQGAGAPENEEKSRSNDKSQGAGAPENKEKSRSNKTDRLIAFCAKPRTLQEIADYLGFSDRYRMKRIYIDPILGKYIRMTDEESINSPHQKYVAMGNSNQ